MSENKEIKEYEKPILLEDLGMKFPTENSKKKKRFGLFKCFCGNTFETQTHDVKHGKKKSCGCLKGGVTHGLAKHILYNTWYQMLLRCCDTKNKNYSDYGGRGITVCERWHSVENFIQDMFPSYIEGLTLDRIDVNGGYNLDNCRWVTKSVQARNTRILMSTNSSGFRGVSWYKINNKWRVKIRVNSKDYHLGYFNTAIEGAIAYNNFVIENNLEHPLNIIPEDYLKEESND